ncbi:MAG: alanine racemase, partial [Candidatus Sumerlaeota bacterium]|nr:alanine racemase [Candidatus Sumerlaeota bacterium]
MDAPSTSPSFLPRIRVDVDLQALRRNARAVRRRVGVRCLFALKKDAYGHGALRCARALESEGADYFGVASAAEGLELRQAGIRTPILVFGIAGSDEAPRAVQADLTLTVVEAGSLRTVAEAAAARNRRARVHLKVDTGMGRIGLPAEQQDDTLRAIAQCPSVALEGVYSHLVDGETDRDLSLRQARRLSNLVDHLSPRPPLCHLAGSAGSLIPECRF